jgi:hypothetical protein
MKPYDFPPETNVLERITIQASGADENSIISISCSFTKGLPAGDFFSVLIARFKRR